MNNASFKPAFKKQKIFDRLIQDQSRNEILHLNFLTDIIFYKMCNKIDGNRKMGAGGKDENISMILGKLDLKYIAKL